MRARDTRGGVRTWGGFDLVSLRQGLLDGGELRGSQLWAALGRERVPWTAAVQAESLRVWGGRATPLLALVACPEICRDKTLPKLDRAVNELARLLYWSCAGAVVRSGPLAVELPQVTT